MDQQNGIRDLPESFVIASREALRAARRREEAGFLLPLARSGGHIHLRQLRPAEVLLLTQHSAEMQAIVLRAFQDEAAAGEPTGPMTVERAVRLLDERQEFVDRVCMAAALNPRLVATEAEIAGPGDALIDDLHPEERQEIARAAQGNDAEMAKRLIPFPGAGVAGLAAVPVGAAERPAPIPFAGAAASGR